MHDIQQRLWSLLGDLPDFFTPTATITRREQHDTYILEHITFANGVGDVVYGYMLLPNTIESPAPAILYNHIHGAKYHVGKAMMIDTSWGKNGIADGIALVEAGFVVFGIDAYAFGERQHQGAAGERESGSETEQALFKQFLWEGKTLWGMMLHDDLLALTYLQSRPEVDSKRLGTTGMSLGGSRATWIAALSEHIKVVVPIAQMTRYADFAATGNYNLHSIYYYVPNMLAEGIDMEHIVSLAAPAYQHILIGDSDPLSPIGGVQTIENFARQHYAEVSDVSRFNVTVYEGVGHAYPPQMHHDMVATFKQYL